MSENKISVKDFATAVRKKYKGFEHQTDFATTQRMLELFPEYNDIIQWPEGTPVISPRLPRPELDGRIRQPEEVIEEPPIEVEEPKKKPSFLRQTLATPSRLPLPGGLFEIERDLRDRRLARYREEEQQKLDEKFRGAKEPVPDDGTLARQFATPQVERPVLMATDGIKTASPQTIEAIKRRTEQKAERDIEELGKIPTYREWNMGEYAIMLNKDPDDPVSPFHLKTRALSDEDARIVLENIRKNALGTIPDDINVLRTELNKFKDAPGANEHRTIIVNQANQLLRQIERLKKATGRNEFHEAISGFSAPIAGDFWTLNLNKVFRDFNILDIVNRFERGEELKREEEILLATVGLHNHVMSSALTNIGYDVTRGIAETVPFMAWFALTRKPTDMAFRALNSRINSMAATGVFSKLLKNPGTKLAMHAAVHSPQALLSPEMYSTVARKLTGNVIINEQGEIEVEGRENLWNALWDGFLTGAADPVFNRYGADIFPRIGARFNLNNLAGDANALQRFFAKLQRAVGWEGSPVELLEEQLVAVVQQGFVEGNWQYFINPRDQLTLALTVFAMGGAMAGTQKLAGYAGRNQKKDQASIKLGLQKAGVELRNTFSKNPDVINRVRQITANEDPNVQMNNLVDLYQEQQLNGAQAAVLMRYMFYYNAQRAMNTTADVQRMQEAENAVSNIIGQRQIADPQTKVHKDGTIKQGTYQGKNVHILDGNEKQPGMVVILKEDGTKEAVTSNNVENVITVTPQQEQAVIDSEKNALLEQEITAREQERVLFDQMGTKLVPGMVIDIDGRQGEVVQKYDTATGVVVKFGEDEYLNIPPEEIAGISLVEQKEPEPVYGPNVLEIGEGDKLRRFQIAPIDDNTWKVSTVRKEAEATEIANSLADEYENLDFRVEKRTPGDPFAKSEYWVIGTRKIAPEPQRPIEQPVIAPQQQIPDEQPIQHEDLQAIQQIQEAEAMVDTAPTPAQIEAGNFPKGHVSVQGMDVTIENPKGSIRSGTDDKGNRWERETKNPYGYFKRTKGKDGDQIDVFIGDNPQTGKIFIVDQVNPETGKFDRHKVMMGFNTETEARTAYLANYEPGWKGLGSITMVSPENFKSWVGTGTRKTKPADQYAKFRGEENVIMEFEQGNLVKIDGEMMAVDKEGQIMSKTTFDKYRLQYFRDFDFDQGRTSDIIFFEKHGTDQIREDEVVAIIADYSENPAEILQAISENPRYLQEGERDYHEELIAQHLGKINPKSWTIFGDPAKVTTTMAKAYFRKDGMGIDTVAQYANHDLMADEFGEYTGIKEIITPDDVVNFIIKYPSGKWAFYHQKRPNRQQLEQRFYEVTGFAYSPLIERIYLERIKTAQEKIADQQIMPDADLIISRIFTDDYGQINWQRLINSLESTHQDHGIWTVFPGGFNNEQISILKHNIYERAYREGILEPDIDDAAAPDVRGVRAGVRADDAVREDEREGQDRQRIGQPAHPELPHTPAQGQAEPGIGQRFAGDVLAEQPVPEKRKRPALRQRRRRMKEETFSQKTENDILAGTSKQYAGDILKEMPLYQYTPITKPDTGTSHLVVINGPLSKEELVEASNKATQIDKLALYRDKLDDGTRAGFVFSTPQTARQFVDQAPEIQKPDPPVHFKVTPKSSIDPLKKDGRKLKPKELWTVERKYSRDKNFTFTGREKIHTVEDVAFLFKSLESASMENIFFAYVRPDGSCTVQHVNMGTTNSSVVYMAAAADGIKRFGAEKLYFVHNHPSGNLSPSLQDVKLYNRLKQFYGPVLQEGIIINVDHGTYSLFGTDTDAKIDERINIDKDGVHVPHKTYVFDKQAFKRDVVAPKITKPQDVAEFISAMRLSEGDKQGMLVLAQDNTITANFFITSPDNLAKEITENVVRYGGTGAILYGRFDTDQMIKLKETLALVDVFLLDVVSLKSTPDLSYDSMAERVFENHVNYPEFKALSKSKQNNAQSLINSYNARLLKAETAYNMAKKRYEAKKKEVGKILQPGLFDQPEIFGPEPAGASRVLKQYREAVQNHKDEFERLQKGKEKYIQDTIKGQQAQTELLFKIGDKQGHNYNLKDDWTAEDILTAEQSAIQRFGLTVNFNEAGWLLPDGSLLDFSGKRDGLQPGVKNYDHTKIKDALTINLRNYSPKTLVKNARMDMVAENGNYAFLDMGNIRIVPGNGLAVKHQPTREQYDAIREFFNTFEPKQTVYLELGDHQMKTVAGEALRSIQNHYDPVQYIPGRIDELIMSGVHTREDLLNFVRFNDEYTNFRLGPGRMYDNAEMAVLLSGMERGTKEQWKAELLKNGAKEYELQFKRFDDTFQEGQVLNRSEVERWNKDNKLEIKVIRKRALSDDVKRIRPHHTRYQQYNIIKPENYQEWLIRLAGPAIKDFDPAKVTIRRDRISEKEGTYTIFYDGKYLYKSEDEFTAENDYKGYSDNEIIDFAEELHKILLNPDFHSQHWPENNVMAHLRMSDAETKDGKKILFLHEVQSDWGQRAKKEGTKTTAIPEGHIKKHNYGYHGWSHLWYGQMSRPHTYRIFAERAYLSTINLKKVDVMPFINTNQWVGLGMRHIIEHAADKGYDGVAWGTGKQVAGMFKLDQIVESINYDPNPEKAYYNRTVEIKYKGIERSTLFNVDDNGIIKDIYGAHVPGAQGQSLERVIGKDLATEIMLSDKAGVIKEDGLVIGDKGMKGFYDEILPSWVNKNLKKYGIKAGEIEVDSNPDIIEGLNTVTGEPATKDDADYIGVHFIPINDALYNEVAKSGMPLYSMKEKVFGKRYNKIKAILEDLHNKAANTNNTVIVEKESELVDAMKNMGEREQDIEAVKIALNEEDVVVNAFLTVSGNIYYVTDNINPATNNVIETWIHEQGIHAGLKRLIPNRKDKDALMTRVYESVGEKAFREIMGENAYEIYEDAESYVKGEEYLARLAEKMDNKELLTPVEKGVWENIKAWLGELLSKIWKTNVKLTDDDMRSIIRASVQKVLQYEQDIQAQSKAPYLHNPTDARGTVSFSVKNKKTGKNESRPTNIDPGWWGKFVRNYHNRMRPMALAQELILKRDGKVPDFANVYDYENRSRSIAMNEIEEFMAQEWNNLMVKSAELIKKTSLDELGLYMMAKHAPERNTYIEIKNGKKDGSGMSNKDADSIVKEFEDKFTLDQIDTFWEAKKQVSDFILDKSLEYGFINRRTYNTYKKRYQYYVPLRGFRDDIDIIHDFKDLDPVTEAEGRKTLADHPLAYLGAMAHNQITRGNKNLVKQKLLNLIRLNPQMKDMFFVNETWDVFDGKNWVSTTKKPAKALFDMGLARKSDHESHFDLIPDHLLNQHEVRVYENGKKYVMTVADPLLVKPFKQPNTPMTEYVQRTWLAKYTRALGQWHTGKNIAFFLPNIFRDVRFVFTLNLMENGIPDAFRFAGNIYKCQKAIIRGLRGKPDTGNEIDRYYKEWRKHGGPTGFVQQMKLENFYRNIQRDVTRLNNPLLDAVNIFRKEDELVTSAAEWSESITRFTTYYTSRKEGKTIPESIKISKDASVNFDTKGYHTSLLSCFWHFVGANINGIERFIRAYRKAPLAATAVSFGIMSMAFLRAYLFDLMTGDDEDEIPAYDKVSDRVKFRNDIYAIPGSDIYISIPSAHGFRMWNAFGVLAYDIYSGRRKPTEAIPAIMDATIENFTPVDLGGLLTLEGQISPRPLVPHALTPAYEIAANVDFTGRPIAREPFTRAQEHTPHSMRHFRYVNRAAKAFTDQLFKFGGGDPDIPTKYYFKDGEHHRVHPFLDINPAHVEHIVTNIFGGKGQFYNQVFNMTLNTIDFTTEQLREDNKSIRDGIYDNFQMMDIPIANRFFRQPTADILKRWYMEQKIEDTQWTNTLRMYQNALDFEKEQQMRRSPEYMNIQRRISIHQNIESLMDLEHELRIKDQDKPADDVNVRARELMLQAIDKPHLE